MSSQNTNKFVTTFDEKTNRYKVGFSDSSLVWVRGNRDVKDESAMRSWIAFDHPDEACSVEDAEAKAMLYLLDGTWKTTHDMLWAWR